MQSDAKFVFHLISIDRLKRKLRFFSGFARRIKCHLVYSQFFLGIYSLPWKLLCGFCLVALCESPGIVRSIFQCFLTKSIMHCSPSQYVLCFRYSLVHYWPRFRRTALSFEKVHFVNQLHAAAPTQFILTTWIIFVAINCVEAYSAFPRLLSKQKPWSAPI